MVASRGANHDNLAPMIDENLIISSTNLIDIDVRMSFGFTQDVNQEASCSASHKNSTLREALSEDNLIDTAVHNDLTLIRGENMKAPPGDSHTEPVEASSHSTEVIVDSASALSTLVIAIQGIARTQVTQFQSINDSIAKIKKDLKK